MSVRRRVNWLSQQRVDVPDMRAVESAASNDFDELIKSFVTGTAQGYILRGFELSMAGAIGGASNGLQMIVDPGAIFHINSSQSGTFYLVAPGTPMQQLNSATNTIVDGAFVPNAINYVGIEYERFIDDTTAATVYIWNPVTNDETTKTAPRAQILRYRIKITTSTWASNVLPVCTVTTDAGNNVVSITDARWLLFRLGLGGSSPDPFYTYPWTAQSEGRTENPSTSTSNGVNPFHGGDKMLLTLKDWMNAIMSAVQEIKGTIYWYSPSTAGSIESLREDLGNTVITGQGTISHDADTAGLITWSDDIYVKVIGSRLAYKIDANPSTTDITLADNQVAYINLIRGLEITPNLVFTSGSPIVTSVGAVAWTTDLLPGDWIKLGSDTNAGYYEIFTVDSASQVTLTENYGGASTGAGGAQAKYAFGSYQTAAIPSGDRDIFIANREDVPRGQDIFWLFLRSDNGGTPARAYIRFLGIELEQGETEDISDTVPHQLLTYIGSPIETASRPLYVSALNAGSVPEITDFTCGAASTMASNQYFFVNSSGDFRKYYVWVNKDGTGVDPAPAGGYIGIQWVVSTGQTNAQTATALAAALSGTFFNDFLAITRPNPNQHIVRCTNKSAGATSNAANNNVGAPFAVTLVQAGTGTGNNFINDGDSLTLAIKKLDQALGIVANENNQDRSSKLIEGGTWSYSELSTPELTWSADAYIQIPGVTNVSNTIPAGSVQLPNATSVAYVKINRTSVGATNLDIFVEDIDDIISTEDTVIIARKVTAGVLVGQHSFLLKDEEFLELDGALAEINRLLGQLRLKAHETDADKARISAADILLLNGNTLSQIMGTLLLKFDGAVIDFTTGDVFEADGTTPLGANFTPFVIPSGQYFWYGISLSPTNLLADNTQEAEVRVDLSTAANAVAANALKPDITGDIKLGAIQVHNNAGSIEVFDIHRLGVGSGSGSGGRQVKSKYLDPISTTLPTGPTVMIDGFAGVNDDLVLFTNLASNNNRIYKLGGVGTSITWTPVRSFNSQFDPVDGDSVRVQTGTAFRDQLAVFNGTNFLVNDTVRFFNGVSANFWELSSIKSLTILNNTTADLFSVTAAGTENLVIFYSLVRGSAKQAGQLMITHDGTVADIVKGNAKLNVAGVTFDATISAGNLHVSYTSDNSGASAPDAIKYFVARWSDAPGGPSGIPSYSAGGGSTPAGGLNQEIQYNSGGNLAGDSRWKWNASLGVVDMNGMQYGVLSAPINLADNQASPITFLSYVAATFKFVFIEYSIERDGECRQGLIMVTNNGTIVGFSDFGPDTDPTVSIPQVTISAVISGANVELQYTTSNTGFDASFKYTVRRWS